MTVDLTLDNSALAQSYDELSDAQFGNGLALTESLSVRPGMTVLDLGCGTGRLGRHLAGIIGDSGTYIGIDPLEERIRIAIEKNVHPHAYFEIGRAEDLESIRSNSIDVACLNAVFHWITDKEAALLELVRVLKPGGRLGISTGARELNYESGIDFIVDTVLKREPYRDVVRQKVKRHLTTTELIGMLVGAGLKVVDVQVKTVKRTQPTARDYIRHCEASSFGNFLSNVPAFLRDRAKGEIEVELEQYRTPEGIQLSRHTIFAVAKKKKGLELVRPGAIMQGQPVEPGDEGKDEDETP